MKLAVVDVGLILGYFLVVIWIGFHTARRHSGTADFFLAGRRLGWLVVGLSLFASNISSTTLVGLSGSAYHTGISISNYEWMASIVLVFFAVFFIPYYLSSRIYTIPEFLQLRFRPACRIYFSGLTIVGNVFIDTAGTLFAGALVVQHFFPGVELWQSGLVLALLAGLYTAAGGLAAVVYTDAIQAVILIIGSIAVSIIGLRAVGSWDQVVASTPPEMLSLIRPIDDPTMPWLGTLIGVPVLGFYFWCTNQFIVQRVLGARDIHHARWGALTAGLLKLPVLFIMVFPGLMARQLFPTLNRPDLVFPTLVTELLPVGLKGIVMAGLIAAIMSSIDSTLNSASTLVTMDFVKKLWPKTDDQRLAVIGRGVTIIFMLVSAAWVPIVARASTLFEYLQSSLAYLFPPVVAVFLLGLFWKRTTGTAALAGMVAGHVISIGWFILQRITERLPPIHFLVLAGLLLLITSVIIVLVSLMTAPPRPEQVERYTWSRNRVQEMTQTPEPFPWYMDYRWQSAGLLLLTAWMVWTYR
jgi:SSS family solute:Na+ symporter